MCDGFASPRNKCSNPVLNLDSIHNKLGNDMNKSGGHENLSSLLQEIESCSFKSALANHLSQILLRLL